MWAKAAPCQCGVIAGASGRPGRQIDPPLAVQIRTLCITIGQTCPHDPQRKTPQRHHPMPTPPLCRHCGSGRAWPPQAAPALATGLHMAGRASAKRGLATVSVLAALPDQTGRATIPHRTNRPLAGSALALSQCHIEPGLIAATGLPPPVKVQNGVATPERLRNTVPLRAGQIGLYSALVPVWLYPSLAPVGRAPSAGLIAVAGERPCQSQPRSGPMRGGFVWSPAEITTMLHGTRTTRSAGLRGYRRGRATRVWPRQTAADHNARHPAGRGEGGAGAREHTTTLHRRFAGARTFRHTQTGPCAALLPKRARPSAHPLRYRRNPCCVTPPHPARLSYVPSFETAHAFALAQTAPAHAVRWLAAGGGADTPTHPATITAACRP